MRAWRRSVSKTPSSARRSPARSPSGTCSPARKSRWTRPIVDAGGPAPDGARSRGAGRRHPGRADRPDGALQGRRVRRAGIRRRSAADQPDHRGRLARDHDLYRRAESGSRPEGRHVRAGRADARQERSPCWPCRNARSTKRPARRTSTRCATTTIVRTNVKVGAAAPGGSLRRSARRSGRRRSRHRDARSPRNQVGKRVVVRAEAA